MVQLKCNLMPVRGLPGEKVWVNLQTGMGEGADAHNFLTQGSARCTASENQHSKGYPVTFTKLLLRRRFIHCAMVILLCFLSSLSSLSIGMRKQFQRDYNIPYKV